MIDIPEIDLNDYDLEDIVDVEDWGFDQTYDIEVDSIHCFYAREREGNIESISHNSAMISLFSFDDEEMLTCKYGNWWELNPQRGRSNNSVVVLNSLIKQSEFNELWKKIELSNSGEPGIYFTNDPEFGTNPCVETSLRPKTFCNLTEINGNEINSQEDLNNFCRIATFINTLQSSYTDFHYLSAEWKRNTEKDALIGPGITGIGSNKLKDLNLIEASDIVKSENRRVAKLIGIRPAARTTVIKPSGTTSCVLGTSSGIHAWHNDYYIRRLRVGKNESIYTYLAINHPELLEDEYFRPNEIAIISIPQKSPEGSILRDEPVIDLLERVKRFNLEWVRNGHNTGPNFHNVSATISINGENLYHGLNSKTINEWELVGRWMWENRDTFHGLSVLPFDGGSYIQAPFEDISKEKYEEMLLNLKDLDLTKVVEMSDETDLAGELACAGGQCEIK